MFEMSFKEFLLTEENRRQSTADLPVAQRLQAGWGAEDFVISVLERMIGPVKKSSSQQDKGREKLDAIIDASKIGQGRVLAQIKARESGDDILVEWYKDFPRVPGRDKIGQAQLYITMDPNRERLYLLSAAAVKESCQNLENLWNKAGRPQSYRDTSGEVKLQPSRDIFGANKLMMYLKPGPLRMKGLPGWPTMLKIPTDMKPGSPIQPVGGSTQAMPLPKPVPVQNRTAVAPPVASPATADLKPGNPAMRA